MDNESHDRGLPSLKRLMAELDFLVLVLAVPLLREVNHHQLESVDVNRFVRYYQLL